MTENIDVRIVLVGTSHPGNIGAAARAMMNMGLHDLALVNPAKFPSSIAVARASGANGILDNAKVCTNVGEAVADCELVIGASARERFLDKGVFAPDTAAEYVFTRNLKTAIVFGNEKFGLSNEELDFCNAQVIIPSVAGFSSLNLGAAVQVICYALRVAKLAGVKVVPEQRELATNERVMGVYEHFEQAMTDLDFLDPSHPKLLKRRMLRILQRAELDDTEVNILRGFCAAVCKKATDKA